MSTSSSALPKLSLAAIRSNPREYIIPKYLFETLKDCTQLQIDLIKNEKRSFVVESLERKKSLVQKAKLKEKVLAQAKERDRYLRKCMEAYSTLISHLEPQLAERVQRLFNRNSAAVGDVFALYDYLEETAKSVQGFTPYAFIKILGTMIAETQREGEMNWEFIGRLAKAREALKRVDPFNLRSNPEYEEAMEVLDCMILLNGLDKTRNAHFMETMKDRSDNPKRMKKYAEWDHLTSLLESRDIERDEAAQDGKTEAAQLAAGGQERMFNTKSLQPSEGKKARKNKKKKEKSQSDEGQGDKDGKPPSVPPCQFCMQAGKTERAQKHGWKECWGTGNERNKKKKDNNKQNKKNQDQNSEQAPEKMIMMAVPEAELNAIAAYRKKMKLSNYDGGN
jgi:hypothetical protein